MALRTLAGKLRGIVSRRAAAFRSHEPDLDAVWPPLKFNGSVEAHAEALKKRMIDQQRRDNLEWQKSIRKDYRDILFYAVGGLGLGTYFWSGATTALADALDEQGEHAMLFANAEQDKAMDAEQGKAMDAEQGKAMDAEQGKAMDAED